MKKLLFLVALSSSFLALSFSASAQFTDIVNFNGASAPDGYNPFGSLIRSGNRLFGMTQAGGLNNVGCIFKVDTNGNNFTDLYDFSVTSGSSVPDGSLIFSVTKDTLFGMTEEGGTNGYGDVFSIDTSGNNYNEVLEFTFSNGAFPYGALTLSITGDTLFGMTSGGGIGNNGVVFSITANGSNYNNMLNFNGTNGSAPHGSLTFSVTGDTLFGMSGLGGAYNNGNLFSITTTGSAFADLYDFSSSSGDPNASLLLSGGVLYGTIAFGGVNQDGSVFSFNPNGSVYTDLFDFDGANGQQPMGSLIISNNKLYGTTSNGGANSYGTIFSMTASGGYYTDMFDFSFYSGAGPQGDLLLSGTNLYGMAGFDGVNDYGVVFSLDTVMNVSITNVVNYPCNSGTGGSANAFIAGGTGPFTYLWNDASSQTTPTAVNLNFGTYTVYVQDAYGTSDSASVVLAPLTITSQYTQTNVSCYGGNNGIGVVTATGGTPPYNQEWFGPHGFVFNPQNGLTAGTYTVNVYDNTSCSTTAYVTITQPPALMSSVNAVSNISCNGGSDGIASANPVGGTLPYTYFWSDGSSQTTATATGLTTGTYTITVTDSCGGDIVIQTVTITQPNALNTFMLSQTNVACHGGTGDGTAFVYGGTSPYTYLWNDASSQATSTASNLTAGSYTVTVTDAGHCTAISSVTITQPSGALDINIATHTDVSCNGANNGSASSFAATGGTAPYIYIWSNGSANLTNNELSAGTYTISAVDYHGCTASTSIAITQPSVLGITMASHTNVDCYGNNTGVAIANAAIGGTSPYAYLWNDPYYQTTTTATGLTAGNYTITVTDNNNCLSTTRVYLSQPTPVTVAEYSEPATGTHNGVAAVIVGGGITPYTYSWSPGGGTTSTISGLSAGGYCCAISDNNGCTQTVCVQVAFVAGIDNISNSSNINIYPNPTIGNFTIAGVSQGQVVELYNYLGEKLSSSKVINTIMQFDISDKSNGVYLIRILNTDGTLVTEKKMVKTQ